MTGGGSVSSHWRLPFQEMAAGAEGHFGIWGCFLPVLVSAVPAVVRCPGSDLPVSIAGGCAVALLQQGAANLVSKPL